MINTTTYNTREKWMDPELIRFLPEPDPDVEQIGDRIGVNSSIRYSSFMGLDEQIQERVQHIWYGSYMKIVDHVTRLMIGRDDHFVLKWYPEVLRRNCDEFVLQLTVGITVAQHRDVVIPEFIYEIREETLEPMLHEWKCGHCQVPNPVSNRTCDHCGAVRALLVQEILGKGKSVVDIARKSVGL